MTVKSKAPHRDAAGAKALEAGYQNTFIRQNGKKADCDEYVRSGKWPVVWGDPKPIVKKTPPAIPPPAPVKISTGTEYHQLDLLSGFTTPAPIMQISTETPELVNIPLPANEPLPLPVNIPLPVTANTDTPVNPPLPVVKSKKSHKGMLPNGRCAKGTPDFNKWFGRVYPSDVAYPAWKYLSKTSTDVANICRAKHDHAANCNKKDSSGVPWFEFSFKEAVAAFKISRPTFDKSIKQLVEIGFIKYVVVGGIPQRGNFQDGRGTPAQYQLSHSWKTWSLDEDKASNLDDKGKLAALSIKQNPGKPVFTPTSKHTFTSEPK